MPQTIVYEGKEYQVFAMDGYKNFCYIHAMLRVSDSMMENLEIWWWPQRYISYEPALYSVSTVNRMYEFVNGRVEA